MSDALKPKFKPQDAFDYYQINKADFKTTYYEGYNVFTSHQIDPKTLREIGWTLMAYYSDYGNPYQSTRDKDGNWSEWER